MTCNRSSEISEDPARIGDHSRNILVLHAVASDLILASIVWMAEEATSYKEYTYRRQ